MDETCLKLLLMLCVAKARKRKWNADHNVLMANFLIVIEALYVEGQRALPEDKVNLLCLSTFSAGIQFLLINHPLSYHVNIYDIYLTCHQPSHAISPAYNHNSRDMWSRVQLFVHGIMVRELRT